MLKSQFQRNVLQLSGTQQLTYWKRPGKHQTIILLHGFSGDHAGLVELAKFLPNEAEIIVPDLPGFGASDDPAEEAQSSLLTYATYLGAIINKLASTHHVTLIGHSFGCMVAFIYAAQHPRAVQRFIGICPITTRKVLPRLLGTVGTAAFRRFGFERSKRLMAWPPLVDIETHYLLWRSPKERYELIKNYRRHEALGFRASTFAMMQAADKFQQEADGLQVLCPTLFISAMGDNVAGKTDLRWFLDRASGEQVAYCRGGHLAPVVFPEEIAQIITDNV